MRILIALDASPHSERALAFVRRMRWPAGSSVVVASVMQPVGIGAATTNGLDIPIVAAELLDEQRRRLEELVASAERALRESGFPTEGRVLIGDPREVLFDAARMERTDLLVVGSHGRTGIARLMLGSVSSHLVTHAPCSVLVVKGPQTADDPKDGPS